MEGNLLRQQKLETLVRRASEKKTQKPSAPLLFFWVTFGCLGRLNPNSKRQAKHNKVKRPVIGCTPGSRGIWRSSCTKPHVPTWWGVPGRGDGAGVVGKGFLRQFWVWAVGRCYHVSFPPSWLGFQLDVFLFDRFLPGAGRRRRRWRWCAKQGPTWEWGGGLGTHCSWSSKHPDAFEVISVTAWSIILRFYEYKVNTSDLPSNQVHQTPSQSDVKWSVQQVNCFSTIPTVFFLLWGFCNTCVWYRSAFSLNQKWLEVKVLSKALQPMTLGCFFFSRSLCVFLSSVAGARQVPWSLGAPWKRWERGWSKRRRVVRRRGEQRVFFSRFYAGQERLSVLVEFFLEGFGWPGFEAGRAL